MFGLGSGSFQPQSPILTSKSQTYKTKANSVGFKFVVTPQSSSNQCTMTNFNKNPTKISSPQKQFFIKSFCVDSSLKKNRSDQNSYTFNRSTQILSSSQNIAKLPNINDTSILTQVRSAQNMIKSEILSTEESLKSSKNINRGSDGGPNIAIHNDYSIKPKPLEKFFNGSITQVVSSDLHYDNVFMDNTKKYKILKQGKNHVVKSLACNGQADLDQIKQGAKLQGLRKMYSISKPNEGVKGLEEVSLIKKKGQTLTEKEERQVKLLRKKVEITGVLNSHKIADEEKKAYYRQLILEFHPDKTKLDLGFATEIFYFLQNNKEQFLGSNE